MVRKTASGILPEPNHPFARWSGLLVVSSTAILSQSLTDPWNKIVAAASPGFGYIVGQIMQFGLYSTNSIYVAIKKGADLSSLNRTIAALIKEKDIASNNGSRPELITVLDEAIFQNQQRKVASMNAPRK